jgi:2,4-dienoyl-CoA reductase-like NADH-dependent reductase (Old Yellow Enzyme family)
MLDRKNVALTVAGKIRSGKDVYKILATGVDFVSIGRSGILHHDFPKRVLENPDFEPTDTPVSASYLQNEGLSDTFVTYMRRWPDFVE